MIGRIGIVIRISRSLAELPFYDKTVRFCDDIFQSIVSDYGGVEVIDENGNKLFSLISTRDYFVCTDVGNSISIASHINYSGDKLINHKFLDLSGLIRNDVDTYVFFEVEEYTYAITEFLREQYPDKRIIYLDDMAKFFWNDIEFVSDKSLIPNSAHKRMYVFSENEVPRNMVFENCTVIQNSIMIMNILLWMDTHTSFGNLNVDKTILLIDFAFNSYSGLGDVLKFVSAMLSVARERDWIPVVDIRGADQYLDNKDDNVWNYYFEPVSNVSVEEAYKSNDVVSLKNNGVLFTDALVMQLITKDEFEYDSRVKIKSELISEFNKHIPKEIFSDKVLAVIARGTDQTDKFGSEIPADEIVNRCRDLLNEGLYEYIFLATEDHNFWNIFHKELDDKIIEIEQNRVSFDFKKEHRTVAAFLNPSGEKRRAWGERYLFITYCLSRCTSLMYNMSAGTYRMAINWNNQSDKKYERVYSFIDNENIVKKTGFLYRLRGFIDKHSTIVVYGTGQMAEKFYPIFKRYGDKVIFCDKKAVGKNYEFHEYKVNRPDIICEYGNIGIILCTTRFADEIKKELTDMGIDDSDMLPVEKI